MSSTSREPSQTGQAPGVTNLFALPGRPKPWRRWPCTSLRQTRWCGRTRNRRRVRHMIGRACLWAPAGARRGAAPDPSSPHGVAAKRPGARRQPRSLGWPDEPEPSGQEDRRPLAFEARSRALVPRVPLGCTTNCTNRGRAVAPKGRSDHRPLVKAASGTLR